MIIKRLRYLAVSLLVLMCVVSTMGASTDIYRYFASEANSTLCLSFKNNKLTDCCRQDDMQRIYVTKTGRSTGIFHIKDYKKVLCYDRHKMKFKLARRRRLRLQRCRHQRGRENRRKGRTYSGCPLSAADKERLKRRGCILHETLSAGSAYISAENKTKYLGVRRGRVQKHKQLRGNKVKEPRDRDSRFLVMSENDIKLITSTHKLCGA